jgi:hypothetical protein
MEGVGGGGGSGVGALFVLPPPPHPENVMERSSEMIPTAAKLLHLTITIIPPPTHRFPCFISKIHSKTMNAVLS